MGGQFRALVLIASIAAVAGATDANAARADRGRHTKAISISSTEFNVRMKDGKVGRAKLDYMVEAAYNVYQEGSAKFPDDRACYFQGDGIVFSRRLTIMPDDNKTLDLGSVTKRVGSPPNKGWSGTFQGSKNNCNARWGELEPALTSAVGNYYTWKSHIDADRQEALSVLELFGTVTELAPVTS